MGAVYDFNGDGFLDVFGTTGNPFGTGQQLRWAQNDGKGKFTVMQNLTAPQDGADFLQGVAVTQLNKGGPVKVALSWHKWRPYLPVEAYTVPTQPSVDIWPSQKLGSKLLGQGEAVNAGDIDRDGRTDLLLGTKWLRSASDTGDVWEQYTLHPVAAEIDRSMLADINGDGKLDSVVGYERKNDKPVKLAWYEQGAVATNEWIEHEIDKICGPMSIGVMDLDGDGDLDLAVGEHRLDNPGKSRMFIYENTDGKGGAWQRHLVHTGDEHHDGALLVDIDKDGDLDILSIGWRNKAIVWYENKSK